MIAWILNNVANIVISVLLIALVTFIIIKMVKDRRAGKTSCGCGCANCAMSGQCHKVNKEYEKQYKAWKKTQKRAG